MGSSPIVSTTKVLVTAPKWCLARVVGGSRVLKALSTAVMTLAEIADEIAAVAKAA